MAAEAADVGHPDGGRHSTGWPVDRERLGEDTTQTDVHEAVAEQLVRAFAGQPLPPPSTPQPVTEIGFARNLRLIGTVRWLEHPTAGELTLVKSDRDSETEDLFPIAQSALMGLLNFRPCERATIEVAQYLRIGIELDLKLEALVAERRPARGGLCAMSGVPSCESFISATTGGSGQRSR